jgi:hypothetical protein
MQLLNETLFKAHCILHYLSNSRENSISGVTDCGLNVAVLILGRTGTYFCAISPERPMGPNSVGIVGSTIGYGASKPSKLTWARHLARIIEVLGAYNILV